MKYIHLSDDFYKKYSKCTEIVKKKDRPYSMLLTKIDDVTWAIPLRSNIKHNNVVWSDKDNNCGLDLSKAVVIEDEKYILGEAKIRGNEFKVLKGKGHIIKNKMEKYIKDYVEALNRQDIKRYVILCKFSTLQYFHKYIKALNGTDVGEAAFGETTED